MNRRLIWSLLAALLILPFSTPPAAAHRVGIPVTTLEWHAPDKVWHVIHRLSAHDFAPAIDLLENSDLETPEQQATIGRFVIDNFIMVGQTDTIEMSYLGAEEDAGSFFVYFLVSSPDQAVEIRNRLAAIGGSDDRRHALVNIINGKDTSTLFFTAENNSKMLNLQRPSAGEN